jgi:hypothetical protein
LAIVGIFQPLNQKSLTNNEFMVQQSMSSCMAFYSSENAIENISDIQFTQNNSTLLQYLRPVFSKQKVIDLLDQYESNCSHQLIHNTSSLKDSTVIFDVFQILKNKNTKISDQDIHLINKNSISS